MKATPQIANEIEALSIRAARCERTGNVQVTVTISQGGFLPAMDAAGYEHAKAEGWDLAEAENFGRAVALAARDSFRQAAPQMITDSRYHEQIIHDPRQNSFFEWKAFFRDQSAKPSGDSPDTPLRENKA